MQVLPSITISSRYRPTFTERRQSAKKQPLAPSLPESTSDGSIGAPRLRHAGSVAGPGECPLGDRLSDTEANPGISWKVGTPRHLVMFERPAIIGLSGHGRPKLRCNRVVVLERD